MRVLFTGASSFTGLWFVRVLAEAGHAVTATFTRSGPESYAEDPLRAERVGLACAATTPLFATRFGDDRFLAALREGAYDVVCCHGADVTDYRSPDFDPARALASNTHRLTDVLRAARDHGGGRVVLTGSVFEGGEGAGSDGLPHLSPYGLSKALTGEAFAYYCRREGVKLGKFVIPNPFGPYEEPRFTSYLVRKWRAGEAASVNTPAYVRDNIHVSLLAEAYASFVAAMGGACPSFRKANPSGYIETQGAFAERFADAMRPRLGLPCELELAHQTEFSEPRVRINTQPEEGDSYGWNESQAWDGVAEFYASRVGVAAA